MRKIDTTTALGRAMKQAFDLCARTKTNTFVVQDPLSDPGEYRVTQNWPENPHRTVRFTAEWTGTDVHGTRG